MCCIKYLYHGIECIHADLHVKKYYEYGNGQVGTHEYIVRDYVERKRKEAKEEMFIKEARKNMVFKNL